MLCVAASTPTILHTFVGYDANVSKAEVKLLAREYFCYLLTCLLHNDTAHKVPEDVTWDMDLVVDL